MSGGETGGREAARIIDSSNDATMAKSEEKLADQESGSSASNQVTNDESQKEDGGGGDRSTQSIEDSPGSDRESTCTVRSVVRCDGSNNIGSKRDDDTQKNLCDDQMILSVTKLPLASGRLDSSEQCDDDDELIEVELMDDNNSSSSSRNNNSNDRQQQRASQMFAPSYRYDQNLEHSERNFSGCRHAGSQVQAYRPQTPTSLLAYEQRTSHDSQQNKKQTHRQQCDPIAISTSAATGRGFAEVQPKLTAASQRVRDYLESLKRHKSLKQESGRWYQFFKSIRTELVACLLFTLISSYALILTRVQFNGPPHHSIVSNYPQQNGQQQQEKTEQEEPNHRVSVHLTRGLADSLTVATLTQVFGHISGCHLSPSISLALYVKGHITSLRLAAYLAAQSLGALAGVGLLAALTSSQINLPLTLTQQQQPLESSANESLLANKRRRRKRETEAVGAAANGSSYQPLEIGDSAAASVAPIAIEEREPSEGLLMSIMEQVALGKRQQPEANQVRIQPPGKPNRAGGASEDNAARRAVEPKLNSTSIASNLSLERQEAKLERRVSSLAATSWDDSVGDAGETAVTSPPPPPLSPNRLPSSAGATQAAKVEAINTSGTYQVAGGGAGNLSDNGTGNEASRQLPLQPTASGKVVRLKRRKRNRRQQQSQAQISDSLSRRESRWQTVNLLQFALPDPIMSHETLMECLRFHRQQQNSTLPNLTTTVSARQLGKRMFANCVSLPNGSQMFIFQLLGSLVVLLTYLANAEPRRTDLGHKSLSIGISYFVASLLTSQAGGHFANPSQVLALSWLASGLGDSLASWQDEWLIYLLVPLVSGLFGALSHEYIDFTSLRNQNKRLHLRRSFYSLETLNGTGNGNDTRNREDLAADSPSHHQLDCESPGRRSTLTDRHGLAELPLGAAAAATISQANGNDKPQAASRAADRKSRANQLLLLRNQRHQPAGGSVSSHSSPSKSTRSTSVEQLNSSSVVTSIGSNGHVDLAADGRLGVGRANLGQTVSRNHQAAPMAMEMNSRCQLMPPTSSSMSTNGVHQVNKQQHYGRRNSMDFDLGGQQQQHHQLGLRRPSDFDANFLISSLAVGQVNGGGGGGGNVASLVPCGRRQPNGLRSGGAVRS